MSETVHQIKVTLQDISPTVWRRVHVPSRVTLAGLHAVLQVAMGWEDAHLYGFSTGWDREYGTSGGGHSPYDVTVAAVLPERGSAAAYVYDYGDHWVHHLEVEKVHRPAPRTAYPRCSAGRRACPPEDCGGPEGYHDVLKALRARKGRRYQELRENGLRGYDPAAFDLAAVNASLSDDPGQCAYTLPAPWALPTEPDEAPSSVGGQDVDHPPTNEAGEPDVEPKPVNALTTTADGFVPDLDSAAWAVRDALDTVAAARAVLGRALRAEQAATGASANELAERVHGALSRPLVLRALRED